MIDLETLAVSPDATILTIAAQRFDPFGKGYYEQYYYSRISLEGQENRSINDSTINWWANQSFEAREEAFGLDNRVDLKDALNDLYKLIWNSQRVWSQGSFDMTILEHAYKSYNLSLPWQYYKVRDSRTVFSLVPALTKPPVTHNAIEDVRRQIDMLQDALDYLKVRELV